MWQLSIVKQWCSTIVQLRLGRPAGWPSLVCSEACPENADRVADLPRKAAGRGLSMTGTGGVLSTENGAPAARLVVAAPWLCR